MTSESYQTAIAKASEKDYKGAISLFNQILQDQPDLAEAYYQRGLAYFKLGDFQAAIADYTNALRLESNEAKVHFARGLAHLSANQVERAIADAKQAILLKPDYAAAYNLIGTVRQRQGAARKAIASYKKAVEFYLDQRDITNCRRCLGHIRELQVQPQPAPEPVQSAPLIDPHKFLRQAVQKAKQKNYRGAMEDLDWALEIDPLDVWAYVSRGEVKANFGDLQGAIEDSQQAVVLFTQQANQEMAEQMRQTVQTFKTALQKAAKRTWAYQVMSVERMTRPDFGVGTPSRAVQKKLLRLVGDDRKIAAGLVKRLKLKHPGRPEDWYWEKAIYDLERDRS
ncbi:tetratricopeptide tpr-1 repeat-containing protein [Leptolyngbya sp. Heron Island J]|uniref:tetratricopeptide repeat protein n=1 Tax=Leptolyngbya sp. Heron Island J TaxID=1385935 RepID=UPI0003B9679C|nr:tetratricopeptide repeat protein [Leptolyngbya sp. Heron Island J]ESA39134.1 tetratricopeptide tpr-1 repeat-containing protein [Leptolyngbya sp. Heron Island J]